MSRWGDMGSFLRDAGVSHRCHRLYTKIEVNIWVTIMSYSGWLQLDVLMYAKRRKVHADDNGSIVLLTNPTSFIGII